VAQPPQLHIQVGINERWTENATRTSSRFQPVGYLHLAIAAYVD